MTGFKTSSGRYHVCGSQRYRKGMGCGRAVYVPQEAVEKETLSGLEELLSVCMDRDGFADRVNEEIKRIWEKATGCRPDAEKQIQVIDTKITNFRGAIEDGLSDAVWANERIAELTGERGNLSASISQAGGAPRIDTKKAVAYRRQADKWLKQGSDSDRKKLLRTCIQEATLYPENLEVEIQYRIPESVMDGVVAGACYVAIHNVLGKWLVRRWKLPRKGRRFDLR